MQVEIFTADPELEATDLDSLKVLAESLGLPLVAEAAGRRLTHRPATDQELRVYGVLLPTHTDLEKFNRIIPSRVLEVLRDQRENFKSFEVWYDENSSDPILVGVRHEKAANRTWETDVRYILARWGEELEAFEVLARKAALKWATETKREVIEAQTKLTAIAKMLDDKAEVLAYHPKLGSTFSFYGW